MNKFSDEQFIQPRICAEASQILLIAEQNLKFCSRPQRKALRNGGKNDYKIMQYTICTTKKAKDSILIFCRNGSDYHFQCAGVRRQFRR